MVLDMSYKGESSYRCGISVAGDLARVIAGEFEIFWFLARAINLRGTGSKL